LPIVTSSLAERHNLPEGSIKILVTRKWPFWIKGLKEEIDQWLPELAPSEELEREYQREIERIQIPKTAWNLVSFPFRYRRGIMMSSKSVSLLRSLKRDSNLGTCVDLLTNEKSDECSHRKLLKELIDPIDPAEKIK
jgi:uncharacterized protein YeaO (DUF488 family)